jgi:hypothetical protein
VVAGEDGFHVCFDKARGDYVHAGSLERMIPGDYGFEIEEANRAEIEKRLPEYREWVQRRQRPVVGDRVTDDIGGWRDPECPRRGAGTVVSTEAECFIDGLVVQLDCGALCEYGVSQLQRLLPGDAGFSSPGMFAIGDRVAHAKFGVGRVETVDGNKITVVFDAVGLKHVVDDFLERAE